MGEVSVAGLDNTLRAELERVIAATVVACYETYSLTEANREAIAHGYTLARNAARSRDVDGGSIAAVNEFQRLEGIVDGDQREIYQGWREAINDARLAAMDAAPVSTPVKVGDKIADAVTRGDWMGVATMICNPKRVRS